MPVNMPVAPLSPPSAHARMTERPRGCTYAGRDWEILSTRWFPVARMADVADKPVKAELLDVPLVLWRTAAGISVARDVCPHRGVPLSMGWVEDEQLVCPYHGLHFAADGRCTQIPAQPQVVPSSRFAARVFPSVERYGLVWTCLDSADGVPVIADFPEFTDPAFQTITCPPVTIAASPARQVEGFIDVAHFAWIHHEAFADRDNPVVPLYRTFGTDFGFRTIYESNVANLPHAVRHLEPEGFTWVRTYDVHPPYVAMLRVDFPDDGVLRIMNIATPVSARACTLFVPLVRNFDVTGSVEDVYEFNAQIFAEDQAIVEAQCPEDLPLDLDEEAHFAADRSSVAYRKGLRALGLTG